MRDQVPMHVNVVSMALTHISHDHHLSDASTDASSETSNSQIGPQGLVLNVAGKLSLLSFDRLLAPEMQGGSV